MNQRAWLLLPLILLANCGGDGSGAPVGTPVQPSVALTASPGTIASGAFSTITWKTTNAQSCTADNGLSTGGAANGSSTVSPTTTTTYTMTCKSSTETQGTGSVTVTVTSPAPKVSLMASPGSVTSGQSSTITWTSQNATTCNADNGLSTDGAVSGTASVTPPSTTTYTMTCMGAGGTGTNAVTVIVNSAKVSVLHSFGDGSGNGLMPYGNLIEATDGNFYGTTSEGGNFGDGTVYRVSSSGAETVIHSFGAVGDGSEPAAGVIEGSDGNLYGTTYYGPIVAGGDASKTYGAVFKLGLDGTESVIYAFKGAPDGSAPFASLVQSSGGTLYGTTNGGGQNAAGIAFSATTTGTETVLTSFASTSLAKSALTLGSDGNFYGVSDDSNGGFAFKLTPAGGLTVLHSFAGGTADGAHPDSDLAQGADGNFYGVTFNGGIATNCTNGCGTVFQLKPDGTETVIYEFAGLADGAAASGTLAVASDGTIYGTTEYGGDTSDCNNGCGTVFKIAPNGTHTVLHVFNKADGMSAVWGLIQGRDGNLYGTTLEGGDHNQGVVFVVSL